MLIFIVTWVISTRVHYEWIPLLRSNLEVRDLPYPPRPQHLGTFRLTGEGLITSREIGGKSLGTYY